MGKRKSSDSGRLGRKTNKPHYLPTPIQVMVACAHIQREWTDEEHARRAPHLISPEVELPRMRLPRDGEKE